MQQNHSKQIQYAQPATIPSILQWNCNGMRQRLLDLKTQLRQMPYDVLLIQEPRMEASKLRIPGYTAYQNKPQDKPPWVAIFVRNDVDHSFIDLSGHCTDNAEFVGVRVVKGNSFLTLHTSQGPLAPTGTCPDLGIRNWRNYIWRRLQRPQSNLR